MDPVSLTLGIAPLCLSAVSGAQIVKKKLKVLRHHDRELSRFNKRFKGQIGIFQDECQLLLQEVVDDATVEAMLDGKFGPQDWTSSGFEQEFKQHLGRKYEDTKETIEQTQMHITELGTELSSLEQNDSKDGKLRDGIEKARHATKFLLSQSKLEGLLEGLVESIHEFRRLRQVARQFRKPKRPSRSPQRKAIMPRAYEQVNKHSSSFHDVLNRTWSCSNADGTHIKHSAKLILDPDTTGESGIDLRVVLGYEVTSGTLKQSRSLMLLQVRTEDIVWARTEPELPVSGILSSSPQECDDKRPSKVRRLRFADTSAPSTAEPLQSNRSPGVSCRSGWICDPSDLCKSKNLCGDIFAQPGPSTPREQTCIGYLDSTCNLRHRLLTSCDRQSQAVQTISRSPIPLASILDKPADAHLSVPDQLRLALRLARSVLQFHSTPWWRQHWDLSDLSYFDIDQEVASSLSTLHVGSALCGEVGMRMRGLLEATPPPPRSDDETLRCGIRNVTMYSLGAALLQISRWELLDACDVVQLRRKAGQPSRLGPRYDDLASKCLYCDFGFGADLAKRQLQYAFYADVVCELEQMVGLYDRPTQYHLHA